MRGLILMAAFGAAALTGCYVQETAGASYSGGAYVTASNDGYWYRSNNYYAGWYFYERPPVAVLRIDRPYAYAHYRPAGWHPRTAGPPPRGGWHGNPPPAGGGWRGSPPPAGGGGGGWHGAPPPAQARPAPAAGFAGRPMGGPPGHAGAPPHTSPPPPAAHPAPARGGGGWHGKH